jgi:hypothetical protein
MDTAEAIRSFSLLDSEEQAIFLALLAYELTIVARDTYEVGGEGLTNPGRMRAINEIQHRLTSFLRALLQGDPNRYPDDVLIRIVLENPTDSLLQQQLLEAFRRVLSLVRAAV